MHIGILQTGHAAPEVLAGHGDYPSMFEHLLAERGLTFSTWAVLDDAFPDGPEAAEGWLITGSRHGAYEDLPWIPRLEGLIRDIHAAGRPLVGICFGHQIIAQALGGRVEKFAGGWSVGRTDYDFGDETLALNAWHQDQVVTDPDGARIIATSARCRNAGMVIGDTILTIQPHPEFDGPTVSALIEHRGRGTVPDELLDVAAARTADPLSNARAADRIADFLKAAHA